MSCIYLLSPTHCLYMVRILKIDPCVHVKYEMWMKLVKNELFIEKKLGQNGCWNLILPLENNIGRWIEIQAKSDHWIITQLLGFNSGRWITSNFNLDHQMHMKLIVGARTKSGPSNQCREAGSHCISSRCKASIFSKNLRKNR